MCKDVIRKKNDNNDNRFLPIENFNCKPYGYKVGDFIIEYPGIKELWDVKVGDIVIYSPGEMGEDFECIVVNVFNDCIELKRL